MGHPHLCWGLNGKSLYVNHVFAPFCYNAIVCKKCFKALLQWADGLVDLIRFSILIRL